MTTNATFEQTVKAAKASDDFLPVWDQFVRTAFFVGVLPQDDGPQTENFLFQVRTGPRGEPMVMVSEDLDRLQTREVGRAIRMHGGDLVSRLNPDVGILVALSDGNFGIPVDLVGTLRAAIQATGDTP